MQREFWVGIYKTGHESEVGKFVGIDNNSGGYPYPTSDPNQIHFWWSKEEAEAYAKMFPKIVIQSITPFNDTEI